MNTFREPTSEMPEWIEVDPQRPLLYIKKFPMNLQQTEALLEVLLDICPNAKALAHNWMLEEQKREYMKGGREP